MPVLVRLPQSADVTLCLSWTQCSIDPNTVDTVLASVGQEKGEILAGMNTAKSCFMDDVLAWMSSVQAMRVMLDSLLPKLAFYRLYVQLAEV